MLEEIAAVLAKLPPGVLVGMKNIAETILLGKSEEDQRIAIDQALAAAERAIIQKEFPG